MNKFDLVGIGVGPFNLSLAALLEKAEGIKSIFFERKPNFEWHTEMMFQDSTMQTSYLKDLVTPVDPTSAYTFLNYLVQNQLFYPFLNTRRDSISRREFEQYCQWVSQKMEGRLSFNNEVHEVGFIDGSFLVKTTKGDYTSKNICVATGLSARIPECASKHLGARVFHAKSPQMKDIDLTGLSVTVVGGGQTGIEVFRNALANRWGKVKDLTLATRRKNLEPLDESAFTNEYFTPQYVETFWNLDREKKARIVASQKLASDGNTPDYLTDLYNDLYRAKHVEKDPRSIRILACRKLQGMTRLEDGFELEIHNSFLDRVETRKTDVVILCTGFESVIPKALEPLYPRIRFDQEKRFRFQKSYAVQWDGPAENHIYAFNFSRHDHGIIDPQTSLMAWRSAVVINDLMGKALYPTQPQLKNFVEYGDAT